MIRKLTFDKTNRFFSHFLGAIKIVHDHGGAIIRKWDFNDEMSIFCKVNSRLANGKENRNCFNQSNFPRYYGFLDCRDEPEYELLSTPRGEKLLELAEQASELQGDPKNEHSLFIPSQNLYKAHTLFAESFAFDSFGRHNPGAEESTSDIDPPKVMMRLIHDLGGASKEEICYAIFALHQHSFDTIEKVEAAIQTNRQVPGFSYKTTFITWDVKKQSEDFKLAMLFEDPGISLFVQNNDKYMFNPQVPNEIVRGLTSSDCKYHPLKLIVKVNGQMRDFQEWVRNTVAGSIHDDKYVWQADLIRDSFQKILQNEFKEALLTAFSNPDRNVFFSMTASDESHIRTEMGPYVALLDRIDDYTNDYSGWSRQSIPDPAIHSRLLNKCSSFRGPDGSPLSTVLSPGEIRLPANFHFIGGIKNG